MNWLTLFPLTLSFGLTLGYLVFEIKERHWFQQKLRAAEIDALRTLKRTLD